MDLGIHPGGGHLWRMERLVGRQAAAALVIFGESLSGEEAARVGLAWRCVDDDELLDTAIALARRAADRPRELVGRAKSVLDASLTLDTWRGGVRARVHAPGLVDGPARVPGPPRRAAGEAPEGLTRRSSRRRRRGTRSRYTSVSSSTGPACAVPSAHGLAVGLAAPPDVGRGDRAEGHELHRRRPRSRRARPVAATDLHLRSGPQSVRERDRAVEHRVPQLRAEVHASDGTPASHPCSAPAPHPGRGNAPAHRRCRARGRGAGRGSRGRGP